MENVSSGTKKTLDEASRQPTSPPAVIGLQIKTTVRGSVPRGLGATDSSPINAANSILFMP